MTREYKRCSSVASFSLRWRGRRRGTKEKKKKKLDLQNNARGALFFCAVGQVANFYERWKPFWHTTVHYACPSFSSSSAPTKKDSSLPASSFHLSPTSSRALTTVTILLLHYKYTIYIYTGDTIYYTTSVLSSKKMRWKKEMLFVCCKFLDKEEEKKKTCIIQERMFLIFL